ncbi:phosphoribosylanthranilate isomerase [Flavobacterium agri]|nr:phosphoribosylanthranilate isomerase [Flavobacterium agri]
MKSAANILEVASLLPDYMGFIFWEKSPRFFSGEIPQLPQLVKKVGVFVDASEAEILEKTRRYGLHAVQLHGNESPEFCSQIKKQGLSVIKAFSVDETFGFGILDSYEPYCAFFLFDTKGKSPGGNGIAFDWELLRKYGLKTPFFISGGIGPESAKALSNLDLPIYAIDINSRFEIKPGLKDADAIKRFKDDLK